MRQTTEKVKIVRPTVVDGRDVFPDDEVEVSRGTASLLVGLGKAEPVKKDGGAKKKGG